jgi:hypothetical protein
MQGTLGSHWRWRLLLLLALVVTIAGARSQAPQWNVMLVSGVGERLVAVSQRREEVTVMVLDQTSDQAPDPAAGRFRELFRLEAKRNPTAFRVVREGTAIAWRQSDTLYAADIEAPNQKKSWPIPRDVGWATIEGFSSDERFAIFQKVVLVSGSNYQYSINVVDLNKGEIVSSEDWASAVESTGNPNEFRGARLEDSAIGGEPAHAVWKLTGAGQWERLEPIAFPSFTQYQSVRLAQSLQGKVRRLAVNEKPGPSETEVAAVVSAASPSGYLLIDPLINLESHMLVGRWDASDLLPTNTTIGYSGVAFPKDDVAAIVNSQDDIELLDLTTGKTMRAHHFGTHRKGVLAAFALGLAGLVAMSTWLGAGERSSWWVFDTSMAIAIIPFAALIWFAANIRVWRMAGSEMFVHLVLIVGAVSGISIVVGWYWTYGHGRTTIRWMVGGLLLCVVCASLSGPVMNDLLGTDRSVVELTPILWAVCQSASIVVAGFVAILLLATKTFGVAVSDDPLDAPTGRFGLASLFVAIIGVSMLLAVASALSNQLHVNALVWALAHALAAILVGNLIVSFILSRSITVAVIHALILFVLLPAIWFAAKASFGGLVFLPLAGSWVLGAFIVGSVLPILIASGLARCHGWRWMRAARVALPEVEAPRGTTVGPNRVVA